MRTALTLVLVMSCVGRASAHGAPPAAIELLAGDAQQAALVRLTPGGFAHRVADGFQFVCPESWGGNVLAPAAALPRGPALVASDSLFVVGQDGRVSPHAVQSGTGSALTRHPDAVFGVFRNAGQWELRRVTDTTNTLVRALDQPVDALAASTSELFLLRVLDRVLTVEKLSLTGEPRGTVSWTSMTYVASARLRVAAEQLYVVVFGRSAPWVALGRIGVSHEPLREASVDIAGPVGSWIEVDGTLQDLTTRASPHDTRVTCLAEVDGLPYACSRGDLLRVDASGVGAPLFELTSLREPDYQGLSDTARADCTTRWLDLQLDALAARDAGVVDAGTVAITDAGLPVSAPAEGCSLSGRSFNSSAPWLALALGLAGRRTRRAKARGRR